MPRALAPLVTSLSRPGASERVGVAVAAAAAGIALVATRRPLGVARAALVAGAVGGVATWAAISDAVTSRAARVRTDEAAGSTFRQAEALVGLTARLRDEPVLPPMRGWAISPDAAGVVLDAFDELEPAVVVDLGSGVTTLLLALAAERIHAATRIVSVDHDADFLARTAGLLDAAGVAGRVELVHARLTEPADGGPTWYDTSALPALDRVDLLVVDGPPRTVDPEVRAPALARWADVLSPEGLVVLDDADRPGERAVLRSWARDHLELVQVAVPTEKGCCVLHHEGHRPALLDRHVPPTPQ